MKKLEIVGHVYSNVNGRIIVTAPEVREQSIENYINDAGLFSRLSNGEYVDTPTGGTKFVSYKKADKLAKVPKVKITITVEEVL